MRVPQQLHWLPVGRRVENKVACLHDPAVIIWSGTGIHITGYQYCLRQWSPAAPAGIRKKMRPLSVVPCAHSSCGRSFNIAGPRVCNSLAPKLRQDTSYKHFTRLLKSFLFGSQTLSRPRSFVTDFLCPTEILLFTYKHCRLLMMLACLLPMQLHPAISTMCHRVCGTEKDVALFNIPHCDRAWISSILKENRRNLNMSLKLIYGWI